MYKNPTATEGYEHEAWAVDPKTKKRSRWTFRRHKSTADSDAVRALAVDSTTKTNMRAFREAQRRGEDYEPETKITVKRNAALCLMAHQSVGWEGPEFVLPKDAVTADGEPHPCAGGLARHDDPDDIDLVVEEYQLEEIERWLNKLYGGRSEAEQATFREGNSGVHESEPTAPGAAGSKLTVVSA